MDHYDNQLRTCRFNGSAAVKIEEHTTVYRKLLELPPDPLEELSSHVTVPQPIKAAPNAVWKRATAAIMAMTLLMLLTVVALVAVLRVEAYAERCRAEEREAVSMRLQNEWTELLEASYASASTEPSITPAFVERENGTGTAKEGFAWLYNLVLVNYIPGIY